MPILHNKSRLEKGGFPFEGINLALCENPLPPIEEAIEAAKAQTYLSNYYTEPYSLRLKEQISNYANVPMENIHTNAGSELILRQLFSLFGGLEDKFLRFATSTSEQNRTVVETLKEILKA